MQPSQPVPGESDMSRIKNPSGSINASAAGHMAIDSRAHARLLQSKDGESSGTDGHGTTGQRRGSVAVEGGGRLDGSASAGGEGANRSGVLAERRRANLGDGHSAGLAAVQARAGGDWRGGDGFGERADGGSDDNGVGDDGSGSLGFNRAIGDGRGACIDGALAGGVDGAGDQWGGSAISASWSASWTTAEGRRRASWLGWTAGSRAPRWTLISDNSSGGSANKKSGDRETHFEKLAGVLRFPCSDGGL